jgi:hypothetical protein
VFITTSAFTKDAKHAAAKARGSIVLVDGAQLSALIMDHGVGVSHKALRVPKVDNARLNFGKSSRHRNGGISARARSARTEDGNGRNLKRLPLGRRGSGRTHTARCVYGHAAQDVCPSR